MRDDHLDLVGGQLCIERVAVVAFVPNNAFRRVAGHHELKESLHQAAIVRRCARRVGGDWQTLGIDEQRDLHPFAQPRHPDAVTTVAGLAERGIDKTLVEAKPIALLNAPAGLPHDAVEDARLCPTMEPTVGHALEIELHREVLKLRPVVEHPEDTLHYLALVRWRPPALRTARRIGNVFTDPIQLCISKLKHRCLPIYQRHNYRLVFG